MNSGRVIYRKAFEQVKSLKKAEVSLGLVPFVDYLGASGFTRRIIEQAMFQIKIETNRILPLPVKSFGELGFKEKDNLQEWLAHQRDIVKSGV